jgi:hypothetical protein
VDTKEVFPPLGDKVVGLADIPHFIASDWDLAEHYDTLCAWWLGNNWPALPPILLPKTGVVIEDYCAGFLYESKDTPVMWMEYIVGNPDADKKWRGEAQDLLIENLVKKARSLGCKMLVVSLYKSRLIERVKKHGFKAHDHEMTNLYHTWEF